MRWLQRLKRASRDLFARRQFEREMAEEVDVFLEMDAAAREGDGADARQARREARAKFGGVEQVKEALRDQRTGVFLDTLVQDLNYAARQLRCNPGFTAVAILTLALGIGANAAIFSVVRSVLLAPLPFADSERLVRLFRSQKDSRGQTVLADVPSLFFHTVREHSRLITDAAASRFSNLTLLDEAGPARMVGIGVTDRWLETLGVQPVLGRGPTREEQQAGGGSRVTLISYAFWQDRYGGDRGVLGRALPLNGEVYTVIGVMPPAFRYPAQADVWLLISLDPTAANPSDLNMVARLKPGVTPAQFQSELDAISTEVTREVRALDGVSIHSRTFREEFDRDPKGSVASLLGALGFVLLIACASLASLLLARGAVRRPEMALRTALGATRGRQIRQLLTESVLLAAISGVAAVFLALAATGWLAQLIPERVSEVLPHVEVDFAVLGFALLLSLVTGVLFGLAPAIQATRVAPIAAMKEGTRSSTGDRNRLLSFLVVGEVALAFALLAGAGVMGENFRRLLRADVGYEPQRLLKINLALPRPAYDNPAQCRTLAARLDERIRQVPGVVAAGVTNMQPLPRTEENTLSHVSTSPDQAGQRPLIANMRLISPGYFAALGTPLIRGRNFTERDVATSAPVIIVNESAARRYWPGEDPLGKPLKPSRAEDESVAWRTVIGVVPDIAEPEEIAETIYDSYVQTIHEWPAGSWITTRLTLAVRTAADPSAVMESLRRAIWEIDPTLPIFEVVEMDDALADTLAQQRLGATFYVSFAGYALLLASLGTYGVIGFTVRQRHREFGVRLALGARPSDLLRGVLGRGLRLALAGLALGLAGFWALSQLLQHAVTEIHPRDPGTLLLTAAVLALTSLLACWMPARRAAKVDPMQALRCE